ncbi:MAG: hypothetical protein IKX20_07205 [Paludibacteraceae bacterium]|nr:hypothetical protein [Paludibacteraceae bacterium]
MQGRKNLRVGVLLSNSKNGIIICLDGTFRVADANLPEKFQLLDTILFEDSKSDRARYIIGLKDFDYYDNSLHRYSNYDEILYKEENGICVPKECIAKSSKFIVDSGSGYQFIIYCNNGSDVYVDWRYTEQERELIRTYFIKQSLPTLGEVIDDVESYINKLDIEQILNSFTIINEEHFKNCPGKDDWYFVHKKSKVFNDGYINSLFPKIDEKIYRDHGFCAASSMRIIGADKSMQERTYIDEEQKYINAAKTKYNRDNHRRFLLNERISSLISTIEKEHKRKQELYGAFMNEPKKILENNELNAEYALQLNQLLRKYYRLANNNDEIDWHNFFSHITRE